MEGTLHSLIKALVLKEELEGPYIARAEVDRIDRDSVRNVAEVVFRHIPGRSLTNRTDGKELFPVELGRFPSSAPAPPQSHQHSVPS